MTSTAEGSGNGRIHRRSEHPIYAELHQTPEFTQLRRRFRGFVFPVTIAFSVWYLLYVVLSNWASDFMAQKVVGNINVALVFGLLQFASTFLIAWAYARFMNKNADPLARQLEKRYDDEVRNKGVA